MLLDGVPLTKVNDRVAESGEQDQTARMYSLILLYTLPKINRWLQTAEFRAQIVGPACLFLPHINSRCYHGGFSLLARSDCAYVQCDLALHSPQN